MRHALVFSGSSHPALVDAICNRLGQSPGQAELKKFSNGETSVQIKTSIRDKDVFIVQSGSGKINDNVMELLIMISACKGGSAKSITAVLPYFPYCRMSKKKAHRGSITARMIANLLSVAGVNHVITIDLHASQMQGFFKCPVDNLMAEPLLCRWIRTNVPNWQDAVVVSKNPGGTKRVTSLADVLKINFGIVTTEQRRAQASGYQPLAASTIFDNTRSDATVERGGSDQAEFSSTADSTSAATTPPLADIRSEQGKENPRSNLLSRRARSGTQDAPTSSPRQSANPPPSAAALMRANASNPVATPRSHEEEYTDERARDVITGRLVQGHIVDDDYPSPTMSASSYGAALSRHATNGTTNGSGIGNGSDDGDNQPPADPMSLSFISQASSSTTALLRAETASAADDNDDDDDDYGRDIRDPEHEATVTLVGNVRDRPVFIVDDMIDKPAMWVAAAETVVKRGGATRVFCMATHGLFGENCLEEMQACKCIDGIVVTNAFPIPPEKLRQTEKLVVLDVANLVAEAIRRNHYGESISQLHDFNND